MKDICIQCGNTWLDDACTNYECENFGEVRND